MATERYSIRAMRGMYDQYVSDGQGDYISNPQSYADWERENMVAATVQAHHHEQHIWSSTTPCGVSVQGKAKLDELRAAGYDLYVMIAGREIGLAGWN